MGRLLERIRIGIVGLGWIGQEVARAALEDPRVRLVGVADTDPAKAGRDLGEIIGEGRLGVPIDAGVEDMLSRARPEVAVLCTTSDVEKLGPALEACVAHGAHVVTTCENLADPDLALSQLEPGFEQRVRDANLVVLATGVNPGFAMDRLPVMLTQATRNVRRVRVVRVVNASTRRAQLQSKIGVGMTPHEFSEAIQHGEIGHAGLSGSLRLLAKGLGITLEKTSEAFTPVIAEQTTTSSVLGPVRAGCVRGIYQIARGYRARREVITLELTMALDEPHPRDTIDIVGEPPLHFEGELPGDACTVASVLSAISVIVTMPAGLRTVLDVPLEQPEEPSAPREVVFVKRRSETQLPAPAAPSVEAARAEETLALEGAPKNGAAEHPVVLDAAATLVPMDARALEAAPAAPKKTKGRKAKAEGVVPEPKVIPIDAEPVAPAKAKGAKAKSASSGKGASSPKAAKGAPSAKAAAKAKPSPKVVEEGAKRAPKARGKAGAKTTTPGEALRAPTKPRRA